MVVALADRSVVASADPDAAGRTFDVGDSTVLDGRAWVGEGNSTGSPAVVAMVPILTGPQREAAGFVAVTRDYPSVLDGLAAAAPNLLTYLGLASAIGIIGSLLVARRVKRQTLGLEPAEITGLVEHRDAMLHGIREGVVGLDLRGRVTLINDEAIRLLHIPGDALGRTLAELGVGEEMRDALLSGDVERDRAVASAGRVLVVNRLPIASRGRRDRLGDDPARPHGAAGAAPRAGPHPARHRHPARPGPRVQQPAAHHRRASSSSGRPRRRCGSCTGSAPAGRSSARR